MSQISGSFTLVRLSEAVRLRLREEMSKKQMSQRDVAGLLQWSQSRVAHLLTGRVELGVDELEGFAFALGLRVTELVRDRGMEFVTEMTPSELRLFEFIRTLTPDRLNAFYVFFALAQDNHRHAIEPTKRAGVR